jgi:hypothetical protein
MTLLDRVFEYIGIVSTIFFVLLLVALATGKAKVSKSNPEDWKK